MIGPPSWVELPPVEPGSVDPLGYLAPSEQIAEQYCREIGSRASAHRASGATGQADPGSLFHARAGCSVRRGHTSQGTGPAPPRVQLTICPAGSNRQLGRPGGGLICSDIAGMSCTTTSSGTLQDWSSGKGAWTAKGGKLLGRSMCTFCFAEEPTMSASCM
jgi:hypothetical protein